MIKKQFMFVMMFLLALLMVAPAMAQVKKVHLSSGAGTILLQPQFKEVPLEIKGGPARFEAIDPENKDVKIFITAMESKNAEQVLKQQNVLILADAFTIGYRQNLPNFDLMSAKMEKYGAGQALFMKGKAIKDGKAQMIEQFMLGRDDVMYGILVTYPEGYKHLSDLRTSARSMCWQCK